MLFGKAAELFFCFSVMEVDSVVEEAKFLLKDAEGFKVGDRLNCFTTSVRIINSHGRTVL